MKKSLLALCLLFITHSVIAVKAIDKGFLGNLEQHFEDTMRQKSQKALADQEKAGKNLQSAVAELLSTEEGKEYKSAETAYNECAKACEKGSESFLCEYFDIARKTALRKLQQKPEYTEKYLSAFDEHTYHSYKVESLKAINQTLLRYNRSKVYTYNPQSNTYIPHSHLFDSNREAIFAGIDSMKPKSSHNPSQSLLLQANEFRSIQEKAKSDLQEDFNKSLASPFSQADSIKALQHIYHIIRLDPKISDQALKLRAMPYALPAIAACGYDDYMYFKESKAVNLAKHYLWYRPLDGDPSIKNSLLGTLTTPVAFVAADMGIEKAASTLNEYDSINNFTQTIPEHSRDFVYKNGKIFLASAFSELARTAVEEGTEGMTSANAMKFGKKATMQVGTDFIEKYGIEPSSHTLFGKEDSKQKAAFNFVANGAIVLGLHYLFGETLTVDFTLPANSVLAPAASLRQNNFHNRPNRTDIQSQTIEHHARQTRTMSLETRTPNTNLEPNLQKIVGTALENIYISRQLTAQPTFYTFDQMSAADLRRLQHHSRAQAA